MSQEATAPARTTTSAVTELARFFPDANPLRLAVRITRTEANKQVVNEGTIIEYGTAREVLFSCATPLEFGDVLRLRNSAGSLDVEASVVALQYHPGKTAVAARFLTEVPNWIVKP